MLGKEIQTLVDEEKPVGNYEVEFDGRNLISGVYFYSIEADYGAGNIKMLKNDFIKITLIKTESGGN